MLKIIDKLQEKEILVTRGAYENLYKSLGYTIIENKKEAVIPKVEVPEELVKPGENIPNHDENDDLMDSILNKKHNRKRN